jgi:ABC-type polysaccharide/polyol phosphate transport system ATPase subunit
MTDIIVFDNVAKYCHTHGGQMLLRDRLFHWMRPTPRFYALRGVSFTVKRGESVAIVGHNGAGKSTLLNIATGLCLPSEGGVQINGRLAALLELGSGFHPDLTGAENIRINAALLGLGRRQTHQRFDQIVDFSELGNFIYEPLRTYSAGMVMRLAFSVAVNVDPDILIIDEVLGVGDQNFFQKCLERILEFRHAGKTLLCVSHALNTLEDLCDRGLWLDHGCVLKTGPVQQVIEEYKRSNSAAQALTSAHTMT